MSISELSTVAGASCSASCAVAARLEADRVDAAVDLRHAEDLLDLVLGSPLVRSTVSQPKLRACASRSAFMSPTITTAAPSSCALVRRGQPDRAGAGDVDRGPDADAGGTAPWKPVGKMSDSIVRSMIFSRAWSLSGNFNRFQSAYGHHHVLGLAADPAAHVHVAVGRARAGRG